LRVSRALPDMMGPNHRQVLTINLMC
jgi:hypothetical protein